MRDCRSYSCIIIILLIVASCTAFGRIANNDFINFDDDKYITENNYVQSGINQESIKWAFTAIVAGNWHPLTLLSHMLDWSLFGANASGHHLVSLFLHIGAVIFLFLFLYKTTNNPWPAAFAAAFFALHPLRVESVAWASERKDVLSMFFGMASIYAYAFYVESSKLSKYLLCLTLFALALMSKPMLVTLPFVLMLLDYWPLKRWQNALSATAENKFKLAGRLVREKTPFFLLTIASCIITFWAQNKAGATSFGKKLPFVMSGANALISYLAYLGKTFWPVNLAVFYPYELSLPLWKIVISGIILIIITLDVLYYIRKQPFLFVGWLWYLGTLIPVIGLVQVGSQVMADRYTYLPSVGIAIMLAWGIPYFFPSTETKTNILFPAATSFLALMVFLSWMQCGYWKNSIKLFNNTLRVTKNNYLAHNYLGLALFAKGKVDEALYHYNEAIRISPYYAEAYNNRGIVYGSKEQYQLAINEYNKAIVHKPDYAFAYYQRGIAYTKLGQYQQAIEDYNQVITNKPDVAEAYNNRGIVYGGLKQYQLAIKDFNKALRIKPNYADAYHNRGFTYFNIGQYQNAIMDYNKAIINKPDYTNAYCNRAIVYLIQGKKEMGCGDAQKACELGNCKTLESAKARGYCR